MLTSNYIRHINLINMLSNVCDQLFVIQESKTIFPGFIKSNYTPSSIKTKYFENVMVAQNRIFKDTFIKSNKINILPIQFGDLNHISLDSLNDFLNSDLYIVFGSSFIKGDLVNFLVDKKAINIHMGISPYYRGTDCNFWALYDNNPTMVGATIHLLSKGLDSGPILYHALSNYNENPFYYTMSTVLSAFNSIIEKIKDESILKIKPKKQNKNNEIRYSRASDFSDDIIKKFNNMKIDLNINKRHLENFKDPHILKK